MGKSTQYKGCILYWIVNELNKKQKTEEEIIINNRKSMRFHAKSLFVRYFLSAFIVFTLPLLLFGFFAFNSATGKLNGEVNNNNVYKLEKISSSMEEMIEP
jgi:hypothetical protein